LLLILIQEQIVEIYVGNFAYSTTERELKRLFSPYGVVENVHLITDHYTRQSKCFGYIRMERHQDGEKAIENLHDKTVNEQKIVVKKAHSRSNRQGSRW
jgi:RNA recognition motif-containing protein